jgi:3-methyladenine DNA glycosylase AlkD
MNQTEALVAEIRAYCQAHADPKQVERYRRFFAEGYDAWGLLNNKQFWTAKRDEWLARYAALPLSSFLDAGEMLFKSGKYEEGGMAIAFIAARREVLNAKTVTRLADWFRAGLGNWAHCDVLCGTVIGPLLAGGRLRLRALAPWRASAFKYQRRAVPVSLLSLLKAGAKVPELLDFIRPLMLDPERVVHQGVGWFLREAWKEQARPVEAFLREWKDTAPRLIFQYATEKMTAEQRARFRAAKPSQRRARASR